MCIFLWLIRAIFQFCPVETGLIFQKNGLYLIFIPDNFLLEVKVNLKDHDTIHNVTKAHILNMHALNACIFNYLHNKCIAFIMQVTIVNCWGKSGLIINEEFECTKVIREERKRYAKELKR